MPQEDGWFLIDLRLCCRAEDACQAFSYRGACLLVKKRDYKRNALLAKDAVGRCHELHGAGLGGRWRFSTANQVKTKSQLRGIIGVASVLEKLSKTRSFCV